VFGFPGEFEDDFVSAWKEPFTGFELKWIEVEICRQATIPTNITDLFEKMKERYPDLEDTHQSKFYRIVSSLVKDGYLEDRQDGRAKIIHTKPAGVKELGRITRYFFEIQMERFKSTLWQDLIKKITAYTGCLLDQQVVVIGPEYNTVNTLIQECFTCPAREGPSEIKNIEEYQGNFMFLNYNAMIQGNSSASSIWDLKEIDDWIFKDESIDVVVMFNALSAFTDKAQSLLKEASRVINPDGKIVIFEVTKRDSPLITTFMREAMLLLNYSNPYTNWQIPEELPDLYPILDKWLANTSLTLVKEFPDVVSSIFVFEESKN